MSTAEPDFLDAYADNEAESETPETEEEPELDEAEEEAETGEKDPSEASPAEENEEKGPVPYQALKAEREKRKERDKRVAELEAELKKARPSAQQERPQVEPEPEKTFWEDPDAYIENRLSKSQRELQHRLLVEREDDMREKHADYDEVIEKVKEYGQSNPAVLQQILAAPNPAKAGYQFGKQLDELKQMEDPAAYREKVRAEIRAELEKEMGEASADKARVAAAVPPDLSSTRSVGSKSSAREPDPFKELFPRK